MTRPDIGAAAIRHAATAALLALAATAWPRPAPAIEMTPGGDFVFDISSPRDMRKVGELSGITIKTDLPPSIGRVECARWARRFGVRPFKAVVSGTRPDRPTRVWICAGEVDNRELSEAYCEDMGMIYVGHVGPVVTCRFREEA